MNNTGTDYAVHFKQNYKIVGRNAVLKKAGTKTYKLSQPRIASAPKISKVNEAFANKQRLGSRLIRERADATLV